VLFNKEADRTFHIHIISKITSLDNFFSFFFFTKSFSIFLRAQHFENHNINCTCLSSYSINVFKQGKKTKQ